MAPIYDVVSTSVYVGVSQELGLPIGGEYHLDDVSAEALVAEASTWALDQRRLVRLLRRPPRLYSKPSRRCGISSAPRVAIIPRLTNSRLAWYESPTRYADPD